MCVSQLSAYLIMSGNPSVKFIIEYILIDRVYYSPLLSILNWPICLPNDVSLVRNIISSNLRARAGVSISNAYYHESLLRSITTQS